MFWVGEGFLRKIKEDDIYLKFGNINNLNKFFFGQANRQTDTDRPTDRPTDRQTEIVVHKEVTKKSRAGEPEPLEKKNQEPEPEPLGKSQEPEPEPLKN